MKRNWKRILSLWLTVCMVFTMNFGLGATAVYAAGTPLSGDAGWEADDTSSVDQTKTPVQIVGDVKLTATSSANDLALASKGDQKYTLTLEDSGLATDKTVTITGGEKALHVVNNGTHIKEAADSNTTSVNGYYIATASIKANDGTKVTLVDEHFDETSPTVTLKVENLSANKATLDVYSDGNEGGPEGTKEISNGGDIVVDMNSYVRDTNYTARLTLDGTDAGYKVNETTGDVYSGKESGSTGNAIVNSETSWNAGNITELPSTEWAITTDGTNLAKGADATYTDKKLDVKTGKGGTGWTAAAQSNGVALSINTVSGNPGEVTVEVTGTNDGLAYITSGNGVTLKEASGTAIALLEGKKYVVAAGNTKIEQPITATPTSKKDSVSFNFDSALGADAIAILKQGSDEVGRKNLRQGEKYVEFKEGLDAGTAYTLELIVDSEGEDPFGHVIGKDGNVYTGFTLTGASATTSANGVTGVTQTVSKNGNIIITNTGAYDVEYVVSENNVDGANTSKCFATNKISKTASNNKALVTGTVVSDEAKTYYIYYRYNDSGVISEWSDPVTVIIPAKQTISANWKYDISAKDWAYGDNAKLVEYIKAAAEAKISDTKNMGSDKATVEVRYTAKDTYAGYTGDVAAKNTKLAASGTPLSENSTFDAKEYVAVVKVTYDDAVANGYDLTEVSVSGNFKVDKADLALTIVPETKIIATGASVSKNTWTVKVKDHDDWVVVPESYHILSGNKMADAIDGEKQFDTEGEYTISVSADATKGIIIKNGGADVQNKNAGVDNYNVDTSATVTLTVQEITADSNLDVRIKSKYDGKLYWDDLQKLYSANNSDGLKAYVDVYLDGTTLISDTDYKLSVASANNVKFDELSKLNKDYTEVDKSFFISANAADVLGDKVGCTPLEVTVSKQPVVISSNAAIELLAGKEPDTKYEGRIQVWKLNKDGALAEDITGDSNYLNSWTASTNATLDLTGIDTEKAGSYTATFADMALTSSKNISKHYTLDHTYVEYVVNASLIVSIVDLETGEALSANKIVAYPYAGTLEFVSTNKAEKTDNSTWYRKDYNGEEGEKLSQLASTSVNATGYGVTFKNLSGLSGKVVFYGLFSSGKVEAASPKDVNFVVESITPVIYDGNKIVYKYDDKFTDKKTGQAKKGSSKKLNVVVKYGDKWLDYGTEYTLSYKNNTNAANAGIGKKAPTVVVTGKGDYKGLKAEQTFTILPADFEKLAEVSLSKEFAKYNGKAISKLVKGSALYLTGSKKGKKLSNKGYSFKVYDANGKDVTNTAYAKTAAYGQYTVVAVANGKDGNYTGETAAVDFFGIPSTSKTMKVTGVLTKADYTKAGKVVDDFIDKSKFVVTIDKNTKIVSSNNTNIKVELVKEKAYTDTDNVVEKLTDAGTYYVRIKPAKFNTFASQGVFEPAYVKVNYKGFKVNKAVTLTTTKFSYNGDNHELDLKISNKVENAGDIYISARSYNTNTVNGYTDTALGTLSDFSSGKIAGTVFTSKGTLNSSAETYGLVVEGKGSCEGSYVLNYTVTAPKYNKDMVQAYVTDSTTKTNEDKALSYNKAGYSDSVVHVYWKDPANANATATEIYDYDITWPKSINAGKVKITIKGNGSHFSGSFKKEVTINKTNIKDVTYNAEYSSALLSSNKANPYLVQTKLLESSTAFLEQGKDYKVTSVTETSTTKAKAVLDASKSKNYFGTRDITYDLYPTEVTKVVLTLDKKEVSVNNIDDRKTDELGYSYLSAFKDKDVQITKAEIYLKGKTTPVTVTGSSIGTTFYVGHYNAKYQGTDARIAVRFKTGTKYPTGVEYLSDPYTIYLSTSN